MYREENERMQRELLMVKDIDGDIPEKINPPEEEMINLIEESDDTGKQEKLEESNEANETTEKGGEIMSEEKKELKKDKKKTGCGRCNKNADIQQVNVRPRIPFCTTFIIPTGFAYDDPGQNEREEDVKIAPNTCCLNPTISCGNVGGTNTFILTLTGFIKILAELEGVRNVVGGGGALGDFESSVCSEECLCVNQVVCSGCFDENYNIRPRDLNDAISVEINEVNTRTLNGTCSPNPCGGRDPLEAVVVEGRFVIDCDFLENLTTANNEG